MNELRPEHLGSFITEELYNVPEGGPDSNPAPGEIGGEAQLLEKLLIVTEPLDDTTKPTLDKILHAIRLPQNGHRIAASLDKDEMSRYRFVLIFGFVNEFAASNELYTVIQRDEQEVMRSLSVAQLENDRDEKLRLWKALKGWMKVR